MWLAIIIILWSLPVLAVWLPSLTRSLESFWRRNTPGVVVLVVAIAVYATINVGRAIAGKGGGTTNPPPPAVVSPARGVINLYKEDANGHLHPIDAELRRAP